MNEEWSLTCQHCRHWKRLPSDPLQLGAPVLGECRERVHSALVPLSTPQGIALQQHAYYPRVAAVMPACAQFAPVAQS